MKRITPLVLVLSLLLGFTSSAQDSTATAPVDSATTKRTMAYGSVARVFPFAKGGSGTNVSLVVQTTSNFLLSATYNGLRYKDKKYDEDKAKTNPPIHKIREFNFSIGGISPVGRKVFFTYQTGPSYVSYEKPTNITIDTGGWGGIIRGSSYEFETEEFGLFGWNAKTDFIFLLGKSLGINTGLSVTATKEVAYGGVHIGLSIGDFGL